MTQLQGIDTSGYFTFPFLQNDKILMERVKPVQLVDAWQANWGNRRVPGGLPTGGASCPLRSLHSRTSRHARIRPQKLCHWAREGHLDVDVIYQ
jgi:hypothetical protein